MSMPSFWRHFEEACPTSQTTSDAGAAWAVKTQTRAREEPDQRDSSTSASTKTMTKTREEPDQDAANQQYNALPRKPGRGTKTITEAREKDDQDPSNRAHAAIPRNA